MNASGVMRHPRAAFRHDLRAALPRGLADQQIRHAVKQRRNAGLARDGDVGGSLDEGGFGVRLRLGADERQAFHSLRGPPRQFQHDVTADGAADKDGVDQIQPVEQGESVGGKLRHAEDRRVRHALELTRPAKGRRVPSLRGRADRARSTRIFTALGSAVQFLNEGSPVVVIQRGGMKEHHRHTATGVQITESRALELKGPAHT